MLSKHQVDEFILAAKEHYTDAIEYHNWSHVEAVMAGVEALSERAETRGITLAKEALLVAAAWHDAGFHEDHVSLGFETKEHYSAYLADTFLQSKDIDESTRRLVERAILGTIHSAVREDLDTLCLHRADVANIGGDYPTFLKNNIALWREHLTMTGTGIAWDEWVKSSNHFVDFCIQEARIELPRLGEAIRVRGSFDIQAEENGQLLTRELGGV